MPPPRVRNFDGIQVVDDATYRNLEILSYETTESALHDLSEQLEHIQGPRSHEIKNLIGEAYQAINKLEKIMLDMTTFYRAPTRDPQVAPPMPEDAPQYYWNAPNPHAPQVDIVHEEAEPWVDLANSASVSATFTYSVAENTGTQYNTGVEAESAGGPITQ